MGVRSRLLPFVILVAVLFAGHPPAAGAGQSVLPDRTPASRGVEAPATTGSAFLVIAGDHFRLDGRVFVMKGFNYWPRDFGWTSMTDWDWTAVDRELALAESVGSNTIRTGIDYLYATGNPYGERDVTTVTGVTPEYLAAIDRFLELADRHHLKVVFWVLDSMPWLLWEPEHVDAVTRHLESLVPRYADDPRIAAWDLYTDLDGSMLQSASIGGGFGVAPGATKANMLRFLRDEAAIFRRLDPNHPLGVGFCWASSSLLVQDFTDFLMPQFLGADHPEIVAASEIRQEEDYGRWSEAPGHHADAVDRLVAKIRSIQDGLDRPMPIVLSEIGLPSGGWSSPSLQAEAYEAALEAALARLHLAGVMPWALTDFRWPPLAATHIEAGAPMETAEEQTFGAWDLRYRPKPAVDVVRRYFAAAPGLVVQPVPTDLRLVFAKSFVPSKLDPGSDDDRVLAAAVDWIDYLSAGGSRLARVDVGTAAARPYLRDGWSADERWGPDAPTVVWVDGAARTAIVRRAVPSGTSAIALRIYNQLAGQSATVSLDGTRLATLRLGVGWQTYRVSTASAIAAPVRGRPSAVRARFDVPVSGGTVTFEVRSGAAWRTLATAKPAGGFASAAVTFATAGPFTIRARWSGAGIYGATTSRAVSLTVRPG